jgi:hypothetical protein
MRSFPNIATCHKDLCLIVLCNTVAIIKLLSTQSKEEEYNNITMTTSIYVMDGHVFEHYVAGLLPHQGFVNVQVTQASNDWGADIIASRNGRKYAIQVKRWSKPVSDRAIAEVMLAKDYYQCDEVMVVTNSSFTREALYQARRYNCTLVDRQLLRSWVAAHNGTISAAFALAPIYNRPSSRVLSRKRSVIFRLLLFTIMLWLTFGGLRILWQTTASSLPTSAFTIASPASEQTATITAAKLNLRAGPGTQYQSLGAYRQGTRVKVLDKDSTNGWLRVRTPQGAEGWMSSNYLKVSVPQR